MMLHGSMGYKVLISGKARSGSKAELEALRYLLQEVLALWSVVVVFVINIDAIEVLCDDNVVELLNYALLLADACIEVPIGVGEPCPSHGSSAEGNDDILAEVTPAIDEILCWEVKSNKFG